MLTYDNNHFLKSFWIQPSSKHYQKALMNEENSLDQGRHEQDPNFFPKGSIAFFIIMILFFMAVWFAFFALTISRG